MNKDIPGFIAELSDRIEATGITSGNVAEIAKKYGCFNDELYYQLSSFNHLYFLWCIEEDAANEFIKLLNKRNDFNVTTCNTLMMITCGGIIPTGMKMASKICNYKTDHYIPVYFFNK